MKEPRTQESDRDDATIERNVGIVAELEQRALAERTLGERIGDSMSRFIGSLTFVVINLVFFTAWIVVNLDLVPGIEPFDPFPFHVLVLIIPIEAIFLSLFVLISQNRMARQADKRAHLDLQINLLAEAETTKILNVLDRIAEKVGVPREETPSPDLQKKTDIMGLATHVESKIVDSSSNAKDAEG